MCPVTGVCTSVHICHRTARGSVAPGAPSHHIEQKNAEENLLRSHLVRSLVLVVDAAEVGDDDRYWQGNHQDATEGADGAEDLAGDGVRDHISIPAGRKQAVSLQSSPLKPPLPGRPSTRPSVCHQEPDWLPNTHLKVRRQSNVWTRLLLHCWTLSDVFDESFPNPGPLETFARSPLHWWTSSRFFGGI